ncbi:MAG: hypothetical protein MRY21_01885 [Simkaniaceae bacterium]|nr:hypothetical protein [Simkaniaceae bacterium]
MDPTSNSSNQPLGNLGPQDKDVSLMTQQFINQLGQVVKNGGSNSGAIGFNDVYDWSHLFQSMEKTLNSWLNGDGPDQPLILSGSEKSDLQGALNTVKQINHAGYFHKDSVGDSIWDQDGNLRHHFCDQLDPQIRTLLSQLESFSGIAPEESYTANDGINALLTQLESINTNNPETQRSVGFADYFRIQEQVDGIYVMSQEPNAQGLSSTEEELFKNLCSWLANISENIQYVQKDDSGGDYPTTTDSLGTNMSDLFTRQISWSIEEKLGKCVDGTLTQSDEGVDFTTKDDYDAAFDNLQQQLSQFMPNKEGVIPNTHPTVKDVEALQWAIKNLAVQIIMSPMMGENYVNPNGQHSNQFSVFYDSITCSLNLLSHMLEVTSDTLANLRNPSPSPYAYEELFRCIPGEMQSGVWSPCNEQDKGNISESSGSAGATIQDLSKLATAITYTD